MADYNLSIVGLISPTQPGYIQAYRPTLAVKNTGTKPLTVAGNFSVYQRQAPGSLLFQTGFAPATVAAGATVQLLGATYWTPPAATTYTISAHVTTNRPGLFKDFGPLALVISPDEPPEPPIVSAHATQHEYDGVDELNVTGLKGELDDPQSPKDHAARHEQGGTDEMSVTGLHGLLADAQPTAAHGNEKHTSLFVDATTLGDAIDDHNDSNTAHANATNLEKTANKGAAFGYAPLDSAKKVPADNLGGIPLTSGQFLRSDLTWQFAPKTISALATPAVTSVECPTNSTTVLASCSVPNEAVAPKLIVRANAALMIYNPAPAPPSSITLSLYGKSASDPVWRLMSECLTPPLRTLPGAPCYAYAELDFHMVPLTPPNPLACDSMSMPKCLTLPPLGTSGAALGMVGNSYSRGYVTNEAIELELRATVPLIAGLQAFAGKADISIDRP